MARKKPKRPPYPRVLIVTEGEKTEPQYFEEIRKSLRLASAHIAIVDSRDGTEPSQVVAYAAKHFDERGKAFDVVFAVFDRDDHRTYHEALEACRRGKLRNDERRQVAFRAVASNPCFELWLLLHYEDIRHLFHRVDIYRKLKQRIPDYEKGLSGVFKRTQPALPVAMDRAKGLQGRHSPAEDTEDPYTNVDAVVELLMSMKRPD